MTLSNLPSPTFTGADLSARVNATLLEIRAARRFATVSGLLADTSLAYGSGSRAVAAGDLIEAGGHRYQVAASGASDHHLATAGGARLYILPNEAGEIAFAATGAVSGGADHNAQWAAALRALAQSGSGLLRLPPGTFRISYASGTLTPAQSLPAGARILGAQWLTILKPVNADHRAILGADSFSSVSRIRGIHLEGITFAGLEATPTFFEQAHFLSLNGVEDCKILHCFFTGWRGDAIYLGSGDSGGAERHNKSVLIQSCRFDGVNRENRQAISCVDIDGMAVLDCVFENTTKSTMPGTIDLEPNANAYHVIRGVRIERNLFRACGGNFGTIAIYQPGTVAAEPYDILVRGNTVEGSYVQSGGGFFSFQINRAPTATSPEHHIRIEDNFVDGQGIGASRPYAVFNVKGLRARGNTFKDLPAGSIFGFTGANDGVRDVRVSDTFLRCGSATTRAMEIFDADHLAVDGCVFDDCCSGAAGSTAIGFNTGASSNVRITGTRVVAPTAKTINSVVIEAGHTLAPATNAYVGNRSIGLVQFSAEESDELWTTYAPIVEGASAAGSGTYTRQFGRYRRLGKQVHFELEVVQTAHTGTGVIEIQLPTTASPSGNNELKPVAIALEGIATTGGQVGLINPAALAGSLGSIRCYQSGSTGTLASATVPTGAATYRAAGVYAAA